jgi:type IV pilus assembly protein PilV
MKNNHGFTLLEVLVAIVILTVGILGMAGLQGTALRSNHNAQLRSQATNLAHDMAERMRANRTTALADAANYQVAVDTTPTTPSTDCSTGTCTTEELATYDKYRWWQAVHTLPAGTAKVTVNTTRRSAEIRVLWDNDRTGATGTGCGGNPKVDLTCLVLSIDL